MASSSSPLLAFRAAESVEPATRPGRFDTDAGVWVVGSATTDPPPTTENPPGRSDGSDGSGE